MKPIIQLHNLPNWRSHRVTPLRGWRRCPLLVFSQDLGRGASITAQGDVTSRWPGAREGPVPPCNNPSFHSQTSTSPGLVVEGLVKRRGGRGGGGPGDVSLNRFHGNARGHLIEFTGSSGILYTFWWCCRNQKCQISNQHFVVTIQILFVELKPIDHEKQKNQKSNFDKTLMDVLDSFSTSVYVDAAGSATPTCLNCCVSAALQACLTFVFCHHVARLAFRVSCDLFLTIFNIDCCWWIFTNTKRVLLRLVEFTMFGDICEDFVKLCRIAWFRFCALQIPEEAKLASVNKTEAGVALV